MHKLQVQVLTRDGQKSVYETDRWRYVADLKRHIGRNMKVPMGFSRLTCNGRVLTNDSILDDCISKDEGLKRMPTLELSWQPLVLTPKQYREKELELEKLEKKARRSMQERISKGVRWASDQVRDKPSHSLDEEKPNTNELSQPTDKQKEEEGESAKCDPNSTSSESDFLAAYWCCSNIAVKQSENILDDGADANLTEDVLKLDDCGNCGSCGIGHACNLPKTNFLTEDPYEARCLVCKQQMLRSKARLTAGRMSHSIISHIKKNRKKCNK